jgi:hypothetical protein
VVSLLTRTGNDQDPKKERAIICTVDGKSALKLKSKQINLGRPEFFMAESQKKTRVVLSCP